MRLDGTREIASVIITMISRIHKSEKTIIWIQDQTPLPIHLHVLIAIYSIPGKLQITQLFNQVEAIWDPANRMHHA